MKIKLFIPAFVFILIFFTSFPELKGQMSEEWVAIVNGPSNGYDKANKVVADASGNVYVTGSVANEFGDWDYLTIKYNQDGVPQWVRTYNGTGNSFDQSYDIAIDDSGNVYVTGGSWGLGTERDFCTIKYNSNGDQLWVSRYNGPGNFADEAVRIIVKNGFVYVTGYSDGFGLDYHTIKYDLDGNEQWSARYHFDGGGADNEDRPADMFVDDAGNVYVTGESSNDFTFVDMYATVKYNSSGQQQWVARYKGWGASGLSQAFGVIADPNGNVYVTGRCDPESSFGYNFDIVTIKYDSSGDSLWVKRYNGPGNSSDIGYAIALANDGNIVVAGISVAASADYFVIKYDQSTGETIWTARYDGPAGSVDAATSMTLDPSGNVYVTGFSEGIGSERDFATVKINASGIQQWVMRYNGTANIDDEALSIAVDALGNVYVAGMSNGLNTSMDFTTIKYSQPVSVHQIGYESPGNFELFQNYPNPFNTLTKINFSIPKSEIVTLKVYDILGKEVAGLINEFRNAGRHSIDFNGEDLVGGVYFYSIEVGEIKSVKQMLMIK